MTARDRRANLIERKAPKPPAKRSAGRPLKALKLTPHAVYDLALLGASNHAIAEALEVEEATLYHWRREGLNPEIWAAIHEARDGIDAKVVKSLAKRALGYKVKREKLFKTSDDQIISGFYSEEVLPDVGAALGWLKARRRETWGDKTDVKVDLNINVRRAFLELGLEET